MPPLDVIFLRPGDKISWQRMEPEGIEPREAIIESIQEVRDADTIVTVYEDNGAEYVGTIIRREDSNEQT